MTAKNVFSGLVTAVVVIASTLSYSALIFSGPLADALPLGIGFGLISAGLTAIIIAALGAMPFAIAGPDSKPVTVLATLASAMAADVARHQSGPVALGPTVLLGLVVGTLVTGVVLFAFGALKVGRWIRYVPYPVIGGFLAASGALMLFGALRVLLGGVLSPAALAGPHAVQLAVGVGLFGAMLLIRKVKHPLAYPALLVGGSLAVHAALATAGWSLAEAQAAGWLVKVDAGAGAVLPTPWLAGHLADVDWLALANGSGHYVVLVAVTAITLLLSITAIEVETRDDVDVDRELRVNGVANLIVGLCGGMVGTLSVSRTLFNYKAGARRRLSGIVAGAACLATLALGPGMLGYLPVPLLGAMLLQIGAALVYDWAVKGWHRLSRADYLQVLMILAVIIQWGFVAGVAVGVVLACVTFAVNTSRVHLVKLGLSRSEYGSRVERSAHHREELVRFGAGLQIMWLHGFVFFGSANRLLIHIKQIVARGTANGGAVPCRIILLDFRRVLGIDSSAVLSLVKLRHFAEREGLLLALSDVPPGVARSLRLGGFVPAADDAVCRLFPDTDAALEWCEDRLLAEHLAQEDARRSADEWLIREIGSAALFTALLSYLEMVEYQPGDVLFAQGDPPDSLYLIYAGRVSIVLKAAGGASIRLRSMVGHTVVGEMGLYRELPRGAAVTVDEPTIVYQLSRDAMAQIEEDNPQLAYAFHKFVLRTLAARLEFANREIAALQR